MTAQKISFVVYCIFLTLQVQADISYHPDEIRNTTEYIESRGFKYESHFVTTSDGYILQNFRIINPNPCKSAHFQPILILHGLFGCSDDWLLNDEGMWLVNDSFAKSVRYSAAYRQLDGQTVPIGNALPFVLTQFGYDVWLMNSRGNIFSTNHTTLSTECE